MKTKYDTLKTTVIGTIAATLMGVSAHSSAADDGRPIWAGHFEEAYSSNSSSISASGRSNRNSAEDRPLLWAGHFEQTYSGASQGTRATRPDGGKHLLWAGHFEQAYQPVREETPPTSGSIEVAMDR
jgi:hypothetical protein